MKKIVIYSLALMVTNIMAGCLKDKDFEDQKYGLAIKEVKGVTFPEAPVLVTGLDAISTPQTITTVVHLESDEPAPQDIKVQLELDPDLATDAGYTALLPTSFSTSLTVTIPAGKRMGELNILIPNAGNLNPTVTHGMGFRIISTDPGGITLAANFKELVVAFSIKNKYDGVYNLRSRQLDWSSFNIGNHLWDWADEGIYLITSGANSVKMWDEWGFGTYIHPAVQVNMTTATGFGSTEPKFIFNLADDKLIDCVNDFPNPPNGRSFTLNPAVTTSRFDPATKTIYAAIVLKHPGRPDLLIYDTLTYVRPR